MVEEVNTGDANRAGDGWRARDIWRKLVDFDLIRIRLSSRISAPFLLFLVGFRGGIDSELEILFLDGGSGQRNQISWCMYHGA